MSGRKYRNQHTQTLFLLQPTYYLFSWNNNRLTKQEQAKLQPTGTYGHNSSQSHKMENALLNPYAPKGNNGNK